MGSWGTGLYSCAFALDLRSAIGALTRLPFDSERLVEIVCEFEPGPAQNPSDEDYTTFWLVLADQFARRGIDSARARERALQIIDDGADLATQQKRGQAAADLARRRRILEELRARIVQPPPSKSRKVLRNPE